MVMAYSWSCLNRKYDGLIEHAQNYSAHETRKPQTVNSKQKKLYEEVYVL